MLHKSRIAVFAALLVGCSGPVAAQEEPVKRAVGPVLLIGNKGEDSLSFIDLASGQIGFSYTATDNTTDGVDDFDDFTVVVTDDDGDTANGTLHIGILDDEPIARDDTDSVTTLPLWRIAGTFPIGLIDR